MRTHPRMPLIALITATTVLGVCSTALSAGSGAERQSAPARFSAHVDNPWFPLTPGTTYIYRGVKDGHAARDVLTVTHRTAMIDGVPCVVVKDRLYLDGRLEERTTDWYTQDRKGNVWYFGEVTAQLDASGKVKSTEGSWRAGVHKAQPGIYMPAHPHGGQSGRQEFLKGQAEDHFRVLGLRTRGFRALRDVPARASDRGVDAARAGRPRPQAVRARHRHRAREGSQGRR